MRKCISFLLFGGVKLHIGTLDLKQSAPAVMGILNVTPDSFSDGGRYFFLEQAVSRARAMVDEGAAIIDVGGESTRPGATPVSVYEELDRVVPIIARIREEFDVAVSVDTSNPFVMKEAVSAGAVLINDVRALSSEGALEMAADLKVPICLMHMKGSPETMQSSPSYDDVVDEVKCFLEERIQKTIDAGVLPQHLLVDPGFGFGKLLKHNLTLLRNLRSLEALGCPILVGISRKAMIGEILNGASTDKRIFGSVGAAVIAAMNGAAILRVHDVKQTADALAVLRAMAQVGA
jgi:dihydropteroate synthase